MREQLHQGIGVRRHDQHNRDDRPESVAIPDAGAARLVQRHGELERGRLDPPARRPCRDHDGQEAERAQGQDHAAHRRDLRQRVPGRALRAGERGTVDAARQAAHARDVKRGAEQRHPGEPEVRLDARQRRKAQLTSGQARQQPVGRAHERERDSGAERDVEVAHDPRGVVHHGIHRVGRVDRAAEAAEDERDHRQRHRREERIRPRQRPHPVEQPFRALQPPGHFQRRDDGERSHEARIHHGIGGHRVRELPAGADPGIGELVVEPDRRGQEHEEDEHHPGQRIAEQPPAGDPRQDGVPQHVGRHQPEIDQRMAEPPEVGSRDQRIDRRGQAERPRDDHADHLDRESGRRDVPQDDRRQQSVEGQRRGRAGMLAPPRSIARDHHAAPHPRPDHEQRRADVEERMRLHRRIEGVEHGALSSQDRHGGHHRPGGRDPETRPADAAPGDPSEALFREHVAEPHDEERREDERHQDAVRRDRDVVEGFAALRKIDVGYRQPLQRAHDGSDAERRHGDADVSKRESVPVLHAPLLI